MLKLLLIDNIRQFIMIKWADISVTPGISLAIGTDVFLQPAIASNPIVGGIAVA